MTLKIQFHKLSAFRGETDNYALYLRDPDQAAIDKALLAVNRSGFDTLHIYCDKWAYLETWELPRNYTGQMFDGYIELVGQSRDSDALDRSNYESIAKDAKAALGSLPDFDDNTPMLQSASASHWAVGWVETVYVHWSRVECLNFAADVLAKLAAYPIYDESHCSQLEHHEMIETFKNYRIQCCEAILKYLKLDVYSNEDELRGLANEIYEYDWYHNRVNAFVDKKSIQRYVKAMARSLMHQAAEGSHLATLLLKGAK